MPRRKIYWRFATRSLPPWKQNSKSASNRNRFGSEANRRPASSPVVIVRQTAPCRSALPPIASAALASNGLSREIDISLLLLAVLLSFAYWIPFTFPDSERHSPAAHSS